MKTRAILSLFSFLLLFGCQQDDITPAQFVLEGEWELAEVMIPWMPNPEEFEPDTYIFEGHNFSRTKVIDGTPIHASGTYTKEAVEDINAIYYIVLDYQEGEELIGNCGGGGYEEGQEHLFINHDRRLRNTWGECDGLTYIYEKK